MIKIDAGYSSGSRILYRDATQLLRMRLARAGPEPIWMTPSSEVTLTPHRRRMLTLLRHPDILVEASAAILIEAASVSTYRLVSDRVISQPIPDSGPDTVRARVSRLPSGCGSTTCEAVTVTPGRARLPGVRRPVGQLGDCPHRCGQPGLLQPGSRAYGQRSGVETLHGVDRRGSARASARRRRSPPRPARAGPRW